MCRLSWNLGAPTYWNPQGLSTPVMGLLYLTSVKMQALRCSLDKVIVCNAGHRTGSSRKASTRSRCKFQDHAVQHTYTDYMNVSKWRDTRSQLDKRKPKFAVADVEKISAMVKCPRNCESLAFQSSVVHVCSSGYGFASLCN